MSQTIYSKVIGELTQNTQFDDWWDSGEVQIPFFDNLQLVVTFLDFSPVEDTTFVEEADEALQSFLKMTTTHRDSISDLVYKNCTDFLEAVEYDESDDELHAIKAAHEIWDFVEPKQIYISRRHRRDKDVYLQIACECEWEQEHGLQLVFRRGKKLTRISDQDGHLTEADAYNKPDEEDDLLSKY